MLLLLMRMVVLNLLTYVIEEPDELDDNENIPTSNTFQISCNGANDGAINITPSGGSGSYTFNWRQMFQIVD